jgi:hypothetical protein
MEVFARSTHQRGFREVLEKLWLVLRSRIERTWLEDWLPIARRWWMCAVGRTYLPTRRRP